NLLYMRTCHEGRVLVSMHKRKVLASGASFIFQVVPAQSDSAENSSEGGKWALCENAYIHRKPLPICPGRIVLLLDKKIPAFRQGRLGAAELNHNRSYF
ncbi:hypothetical protein, partial [Treponema sp. R80B11-R83G3]